MADFPIAIAEAFRDEVASYADVEGKIPRAVDRLADLAGHDVVLLDADRGMRGRELAALGARVTAVVPENSAHGLKRAPAEAGSSIVVATGTPSAIRLPDESADAVVSFWSAFRPSIDRTPHHDGASTDTEAELAEADRVLRPGGRLLVVHDYGRDDIATLLPPERSAALVAWSRRDGWFPAHGFRMHVVHAFWTFPEMARLRSTVEAIFGPDAPRLLGDLHRPRLTWKVVVYERLRGGAAAA